MTLHLQISEYMAPALRSAPLVIPRFLEALSSHERWTMRRKTRSEAREARASGKGRAANDAGQQSESSIARVTSSVQIRKPTSVRRGMTAASMGEEDRIDRWRQDRL
ncbi:uncharacterized protein SCHCODRAFT_02611606 [Schizophyllum commune H4-8]|uniref:uncharacterized protein n=1 Tax=Schizophyllum commune (strain H4-8 / FGSC 9210) TaxID=578458 RepID=UPI00215F7538|nr:uncharacterized protein SCHCODRAFT_02611606 [Schizophyllum commune H4-8]KAI5898265.1 hypothetical protein SCHCODRAFT_02611606 [Schizophyllum commune H4-8]